MKEHLGLYSTITVVILRLYFIKVVIYLVIIGIFKCLQWNFVKSKINLLFQSWIQCSIGEMLQFQKFARVPVGKKERFFYGLEPLSYCVPQLWTLLPREIKQRKTITKPRIYETYGSYLGTFYDLNCNCF